MKSLAAALCIAIALLALAPHAAFARVERFALVVGNNRGHAGEGELRYAEADAERVFEVLRDLGGFAPVDMVLLRGEAVDTVRGTLIALNQRIRAAISEPDTEVVLFVYYSGHADAERLHLGQSEFSMRELAQLVGGSAANLRLIVLDACRSGALTRLKGGKIAPPFALPEDEALQGSGMAYLTASAEREDAQESDELHASFFTHALVSGLLGAADRNGDGEVVLDEAYEYAYASTLRATSRTAAGTQHPTFRFDVRGRGSLVLTRPEAYAAQRTTLHFPPGLGFLLLRGGSDGAVVAEVDEQTRGRALSVRPGRYFVRARGPDVLYEGGLDASAGTSAEVGVAGMRRIEYAHLLRKGGGHATLVHGPEVGLRVRSPLPNSSSACVGAYAGYSLDFADFGVAARLSGCGGGFANGMLSATTTAYDLDLRVYRAFDVSRLSFAVGVGSGISLFVQTFETRGRAPARQTAAPFLALATGAALDLAQGFYLGLDLAAETHLLRLRSSAGAPAATSVGLALRGALGVGKRF